MNTTAPLLIQPREAANCTACRHAKKPPGEITGLICTRYPPTPAPAQSPTGIAVVPLWPPVSDLNVCGEFSAAAAANSTN